MNAYKSSIWRVPLIALIAGIAYVPLYVKSVTRFGVIEPCVLDDKICLLTSAVLFLSTIFLGGFIFLRNLTRKEIFISASVVVLYGILLMLLQLATGCTTGPAAVTFMYLHRPLEWTFMPSLGSFLSNHYGLDAFWIGYLSYFEPFLFVLFGRKPSSK